MNPGGDMTDVLSTPGLAEDPGSTLQHTDISGPWTAAHTGASEFELNVWGSDLKGLCPEELSHLC